MQIVMKKVSEIKEYEKKLRKYNDAVKHVKQSIKEFGFKVPVILDKNNIIVAGHVRVKAAKELNVLEIPCIMADDLNEEQIKAFRLADNRVAEFSEWDFDVVMEELNTIINIDMNEFAFNDNLFTVKNEAMEDEFKFEINDEPAKSKLGEVYQLGSHRLMCRRQY